MGVVLDFAGFYYQTIFEDADATGKSVQEITEMAVDRDGTRGGKLLIAKFDDSGFLQRVTVSFRDDAPVVRQSRRPGDPAPNEPFTPPLGVYSYNDSTGQSVPGDGLVSFTPSWQYYVFDKDNKLKTAALREPNGDLGNRLIIPAGSSNTGDGAVPIEPGDRVTWRLVMIGGIGEALSVAVSKLDLSQAKLFNDAIARIEPTARGALRIANDIAQNRFER